LQALEKDPAMRFQTADEFLRAIAPYRQPWSPQRPSPPTDPFAATVLFGTAPAQPATKPGPPTRPPITNPPATCPPLTPAPTNAGSMGGDQFVFDEGTLNALERKLTPYLGPIARHLVKKTSRQAASMAELCQKLAAQIAGNADQAAFLRSVGVGNEPRT